jgi:hypothetical protein
MLSFGSIGHRWEKENAINEDAHLSVTGLHACVGTCQCDAQMKNTMLWVAEYWEYNARYNVVFSSPGSCILYSIVCSVSLFCLLIHCYLHSTQSVIQFTIPCIHTCIHASNMPCSIHVSQQFPMHRVARVCSSHSLSARLFVFHLWCSYSYIWIRTIMMQTSVLTMHWSMLFVDSFINMML